MKLKKEHCVKELKSLQKKYKKYSANPKFPKDKLDALQSDIDRKQQEIIDIDNTMATTQTKKFRNRNMALDNNNKRKASIIRNCLSHNGRIRIVYENNYKGKTTVLLSDHNGNNSTAIIKCPIDELFKFLRQDTFRNGMHLQTPNEHTKITSIQALENALKQGITTDKINEATTVERLEQNPEHSNEGETKDD